MIKTPLYTHVSAETAYLRDDYPYGSMRCNIRFWMEKDDKRGYRFVSQTQNPKTHKWNNPKKSTYSLIAGNMYLDEVEHTHWTGITEYSNAEDALAYAKRFPQGDNAKLMVWALQKVAYNSLLLSGEAGFTINGVRQPSTPTDIEHWTNEMNVWKRVVAVLSGKDEGQ